MLGAFGFCTFVDDFFISVFISVFLKNVKITNKNLNQNCVILRTVRPCSPLGCETFKIAKDVFIPYVAPAFSAVFPNPSGT